MYECPYFGKVLFLHGENQLLYKATNVYDSIIDKVSDCPDDNEELVDLSDQAICKYKKAKAELVMQNEKLLRIVVKHCETCIKSCDYAGYDMSDLPEVKYSMGD